MRPSFFQRLLQGRLLKFCVVGLSSTIIDKGIFLLIMTVMPVDYWWVAQSISFIFGVTNGFYWNRHWTFASETHESMKRQYPKFLASNAIGLLITLLLTKGFFILYTGRVHHAGASDKKIYFFCGLCAIPLVVIWNFTASRFWTFKSPSSTPADNAPSIAPR